MIGQVRRKDKELSEKDTHELLEKGDVGRLGTCGDNMPYITPVNYIFEDGSIYFHCARVGHKLDNIKQNNNVCFEVDTMEHIIQNDAPCEMSTNYKSAVVFGKASIIDDADVKFDILKKIVDKYSEGKDVSSRLNKQSTVSVVVVKINPEMITGKRSK